MSQTDIQFLTIVHPNKRWLCRFIVRSTEGVLELSEDLGPRGEEEVIETSDRAELEQWAHKMANEQFADLRQNGNSQLVDYFWHQPGAHDTPSALCTQYPQFSTHWNAMVDEGLRGLRARGDLNEQANDG